jgi:hypothetical protein
MNSLQEYADSIINTLTTNLRASYQCECSVSYGGVDLPPETIRRVVTIKSPNPPNLEGKAQLDFQGDRVKLLPVLSPTNQLKPRIFYRSRVPGFADLEPDILIDIVADLQLWVIDDLQSEGDVA